MPVKRNLLNFLIVNLSFLTFQSSNAEILDCVVHRFHYENEILIPDSVSAATKWCGRHFKARNYRDVGKAGETDRCCRKLVQCDDIITPVFQKYGLRNARKFYKIDCECVRKFRICLKNIKSLEKSLAYKLGLAYFQHFRPKCFFKSYKKLPGVNVYYDINNNRYASNEGGKYFSAKWMKIDKWI